MDRNVMHMGLAGISVDIKPKENLNPKKMRSVENQFTIIVNDTKKNYFIPLIPETVLTSQFLAVSLLYCFLKNLKF